MPLGVRLRLVGQALRTRPWAFRAPCGWAIHRGRTVSTLYINARRREIVFDRFADGGN